MKQTWRGRIESPIIVDIVVAAEMQHRHLQQYLPLSCGKVVCEAEGRVRVETRKTLSSFVIDGAERADEGLYTISVNNPAGEDKAEIFVRIVGQGLPLIFFMFIFFPAKFMTTSQQLPYFFGYSELICLSHFCFILSLFLFSNCNLPLQMCPTPPRTSNAHQLARTLPRSHGTLLHLTAEFPLKVPLKNAAFNFHI